MWARVLTGGAESSEFASLLRGWLCSWVLALGHRWGQELKDKEHKKMPSHKPGLPLENLGLELCT